MSDIPAQPIPRALPGVTFLRRVFTTCGRVFGKLPRLARLSRSEPIFIVGSGRCGSTLLLSILAADSRFYCIHEETEAFKYMQGDSWPLLAAAKTRLYWALLNQEAGIENQDRWVEKTPIHIRWLEHIRKAFGGRLRFIHLIRDGRDCCTSYHPTSHLGTYHISCDRWVSDVRESEKYENDPHSLIIRYEDLILKFDETIRKIYTFLGIEPSPDVWHFSDRSSIRRHTAWKEEVRPLSASSIGRWTAKEHEARIQELLNTPDAVRLLTKHGYLTQESPTGTK